MPLLSFGELSCSPASFIRTKVDAVAHCATGNEAVGAGA